VNATADPVQLAAHYCDLVRALVPLFELQVIVTASPVLVTLPFVPESVPAEPAVEDALLVVQNDNDPGRVSDLDDTTTLMMHEGVQLEVLVLAEHVVLAVKCATDVETRRLFADVAFWDSV
jgi:hypothetical protein